ncbi:glycosyltransferase [Actinoplanes sp. TFC3]|uniref:glycosyltransferase n=1 Tax=Actinoplanes sp. TFC3 TaxID=1710355 RepID=UPI00082D5C29|nr:glycosyltransferase [Actinoplanes sp. TFC3]
MRILFTTHPASGHLRPLVPIAHAALRQGHEVAVAAPAVLGAEIAGYGLTHLEAGYDWRYEVYDMIPPGYAGFGLLDAAEAFTALGRPLTEAFAGHIARGTARDLLAATAAFKPDVIVRELDELGGYLAAEALGVPHVSIASFGGLDDVRPEVLGPILDAGRHELGLPADPRGERLYGHLHANFLPPQYSPAEMILPNTRCYRHPNAEQRDGHLDAELAELDLSRPFVFAGFGTVVYNLPGSDTLVDSTIAALGEVDCTAVLAVGSSGRTQRTRPVPPNVHLVTFVEQALILEGCDAFLTHGGLNSMKEAMRLGVPMLAVPPLGDHRHNAAQAEALGISRTVPLAQATAPALAAALSEVLTDPAYRVRARRLQRHIHAQPPVDVLIDDIAALLR